MDTTEPPVAESVVSETELVFAFVVAVGTDVDELEAVLKTELTSYGYRHSVTRLSEYLRARSGRGEPDPRFDVALSQAMDDGDALRLRWDRGDALALYAISDIVTTRGELTDREVHVGGEVKTVPGTPERHAWILRTLKTKDELATLRAVYGPRLIVIGAYSPPDIRAEHLARQIGDSRSDKDTSLWAFQPEDLIARDEDEGLARGQDVSGTFHLADFFVRADNRKAIEQDLGRCLGILFGRPFETPTRDEHGQFLAAGAAMRSAELGRQVGAAITSDDGAVLAVGTNEVPRAGGGSYWSDDADEDDHRDWQLGFDTNRQQFDDMAARLRDAVLDELRSKGGADAAADIEQTLTDVLRGAGLKELTEFGRAVHAEMNALLDAGRRGVSVQDAVIYSTTFPCHNCARHLIGAGIRRVVFIEPYPKSRAVELHGDAVVMGARRDDDDKRLAFEAFVGVAPRRYLEYFDAAGRERLGHPSRKQSDGSVQDFDPRRATPVFVDFAPEHVWSEPPGYRLRELAALAAFQPLSAELSEKPLNVVASDSHENITE